MYLYLIIPCLLPAFANLSTSTILSASLYVYELVACEI